ncbi:MAG: Holliday junction branch migration DNA helicase RuvB [Verrucomicrobia bacterium]|nr:Holliday junction branch migration DNA helicase RuvB [Verrucomicrobiota bacterium]
MSDSDRGERFITTALRERDAQLDATLRPQRWADFIGQDKVKERLEIFISAAKQRNDSLDHALLFGPPGLGKTTLAQIMAREMDVKIVNTSGPVIERPGDLAGLLTNLKDGDILFVDEIHRLNRVVEEYLYPAMEDFRLDIVIDSGPSARSVRLNLARFTLIGATTRSGLLSAPLRSRFGMTERLNYYGSADIQRIVERSGRILAVELDEEAAVKLAARSRGTPRIANTLLKRVRDYAQIKAKGRITPEVAEAALHLLDVDAEGLDEMDKRLIRTIIEQFSGGPVGVNTIAVAIGEEADTIEEVYEPYLIQAGFLQRTPRGRVATANAYEHFGIARPRDAQNELF